MKVKIPFPIPQEDACKNGIECPLEAGNSYSEAVIVPILPSYPPVKIKQKIIFFIYLLNNLTKICIKIYR